MSNSASSAPEKPAAQRRSRGCLGCAGTLLFWALLILIVLIPAAAGGSVLYVQRTLPQTSGTLSVTGLDRSVSVVRDRWGVPYITAATEHDLFFAQGYVTAQDRLFQMDVNRRTAEGRLAEIFGRGPKDSVLNTDKFLRTLDFMSAAQAEFQSYDPDTRAILEAYAQGVNAFIDQHRDSLPLEFSILGFVPEPWSAVDSVAYGRVVALSLDSDWQQKYARALLLAKLSPATVDALYPAYPKSNPTLLTVAGLPAPLEPPSHVTGDIAPSQTTASVMPHISASQRAAFASLPIGVLEHLSGLQQLLGSVTDALGSNDWVVDGTHTVTGKPLLANDPHLGINEPAIWYEVALRGPITSVDGFSFPGVPGIIIGHNANIAWGVTNVGADNSDLYLERLDPSGHPGEYVYDGVWLPITTRQETIKVRGEATPVTMTVRATDHGPLLNDVVSDLKGFSVPVALKWTALQPSYSFAGFFQLDHAANWTTFRAAVSHISISQNFVYADREGNIGYQMSGCLPVRPADNAVLPVAGDTSDHEWEGCVPFDLMPMLFNPPTHIIVTANNQIVPDAASLYVTTQWDRGYRARRIIDLLVSTPTLAVTDYARIQNDVYSVAAAQIAPIFASAAGSAGGDAAPAARLLTNWNDQLTTDSGAAAIYEVALGTLARETLEPVLGKDLYAIYRGTTSASNLIQTLYELLRAPKAPFFGATTDGQAASARDTTVARAVKDAVHQLASAQGSDPAQWRWGPLHQASFAHPLASVSPLNLVFGISKVDRPGDSTTVNVGGDGRFSADPPDYSQRTIPSMRQIIDLSNFDKSLWVIPAGQSGQPFSPHYTDLLPLWDQGRYESMSYSPEAIGAATQTVLILKPA
ncbi:MAG TPA: penicillin acylase family protein [Ktedonobacterales bacterium]